jgi:hypothetical protein
MFVAVTFGAGLITTQATESARAFLDPPLTHFVTVLLVACLLVIPTMGPKLLGGALVTVTALRTIALRHVYSNMRKAHTRFNDIELSDWMMGLVSPLLCYLALLVAGCGFLRGVAVSFNVLAGTIIAILVLGVYGAWELVIWLALTRIHAREKPPEQK